MFDAAGLVTGLEVQADTVAEAQAEAALAATAPGWQPDTSLDPGSMDALLAALAQSQPSSSVNEIVFVDTSVSNYEELLAGISPNTEVVRLHSNGDGLAQIAGVLEGRSDVSAIHIISHGDAGQLQLGGVTLSEDTMNSEFADELAVIGEALAESADILIYGCNFAGGEQGRVAMDTLARLTGADVAASTDDSGYAGYGGDWNLEHHTGPIETGIAIAETAQAQWRGLLIDTDGDTVDNATDIDDDNDGILDVDEGFEVSTTFTTDPVDLANGPATTNVVIDLSGTGLAVGDTVTVSDVVANGDLDAGIETFSIEFNKGTASAQLFSGLQTGEQFTGFLPLTSGINATVEVIDVGGGSPGITIEAVSPGAVDDLVGLGYGARFTADITYVVNTDTDGDGIDDYLDIDSDNDGITDNVEAQTTDGYIRPSGIGAGITDSNGDGLDDSYDPGAPGPTGGLGLTPIDSDNDGQADFVDTDADGDGIDDIAERGDGQPIVLESTTDTDGDGLVDIFEGGLVNDTDVNDDNLIFGTTFNLADSDDDLAADGSDALGPLRNLDFRENSLLDIDEDGIANTEDIDADNDGILNSDEGAPGSTLVLVTTSTFEVPAGPATASFDIDLSVEGFSIGDVVTISNVLANGDLNGAGEYFSLSFNGGEIEKTGLATGGQFNGLEALGTPINIEVTVIDIGGGVPGISVDASTLAEVDDLGDGYGVQFLFDISAVIEPTRDSDGDGLPDHLDIDSDNDGITDTVEAQATADYILPSGVGMSIIDVNGDGLDDNFDAGVIAGGAPNGIGFSPVDSDGDSFADVIDLDSDADGVGDIAERRDGGATTVTSLADTDRDGLLDIFEGSNVNDLDVNDENLTGTTFNLADTDDDLAADGSNANPPTVDLDFREGDTDNDGILNTDDIDADNDGVLNTLEGVVPTTLTSPNIDLADGPDTASVDIDLSATSLAIGDVVTITNVRADGDLNSAPEVFDLNFNSGQRQETGLQTGQQFSGLASVGLADFDLTVIDLGGGTPGINVVATIPADVDQIGGNAYAARIVFDIAFLGARDTDGDGIDDHLDIDSDNDGVTDNVEAQATAAYIAPSGSGGGITDVNGDGLDDNYDPGALGAGGGIGLTPVDTDNDTIADLIDSDSDADGVEDIRERGDGQAITLTSTTDSDGDGLLDIFEGGSVLDADVNDGNIDGLGDFNLSDSDDDTDADGGNAVPLTQDLDYRDDLRDVDGDTIPNVSDADADGDGIANVDEGSPSRDVDGDGFPDWLDIDSDNDGITDNVEAQATQDYQPPTGTDGDSDGIDDAYDVGATGLSPVDSDGDLTPDAYDNDSDDDGTDDIAERGDGWPRSVLSTADADSDGLLDIFEGGNITDLDPNDENLTGSTFNLADTDDDTAADGSDAVPLSMDLDFRDVADSDGDGIPNALDLDADNDGILNTVEGYLSGVVNSPNIDLGDGPDSASVDIDLSSTGLSIGRTVTITNVQADGDLDAAAEVFALNFNNGEVQQNDLQTGLQFTGLAPVGLSDFELTVIDIGGGTPGINVVVTTPADVDQFGANPYGARIIFDIAYDGGRDTDGDGIDDHLDLDSDNDGLSDLFESGVSASIINADTNFDGLISLAESGAALSPAAGDNDSDGLMDVFDAATSDPSEGASVGTQPVDNDTDGIADFRDLDSDGDGIADTVESRSTSGYVSNDGDVRDDDKDGDGVISLFDSNDNASGVFGGSFSNTAYDHDGDLVPDYLDTNSDDDLAAGDDSVESELTFSGADLDFDGIDDNASIGVSYADPDGSIDNPSSDLGNQVGDTSEIGFREIAFAAVADTAEGEVNENVGAILTTNVLANDTFDNTNPALTLSVVSVSSLNTPATPVPGAGSVQITTDLGGLATVHADGTVEYDPNGQAVFADLNFGDEPVVDSFSYVTTYPGGEESSSTVNIAVAPNNEFELSSLTGPNGTVINGALVNDQAGFKVIGLGDVNGDGYDDLGITAPTASPNGHYSGETYVIFGKAGNFGPAFELSTLAAGDGTDGFVLHGIADGDLSGRSIAAGDINGDGLSDLIISASRADYNGDASGEVYVVFGQSDFSTVLGGGGVLELSGLTPDGTDGFVLRGIDANDNAGRSVAWAGDVNGDGIGDLLVSGHLADPNGSLSGEVYLIFGRTDFSPILTAGVFELSSLAAGDGTDGTVFNGVAAGDQAGNFVAGAGDFNGDGLQDLAIGAHYADYYGGAAYLVYGQPGGFGTGEFELSSLNGTNGFALTGSTYSYAGTAVGLSGDINGDGFDDLVVSAPGASPNGVQFSGTTYVILGRGSSLPATQTLAAAADLTINGALYAYHTSGFSLDSSGDINGDGFDDLLLGRGPFYGVDAGAVYVVFGSSSPPSTLELSTLIPVSTATTGGVADETISDGFVLSGVDFDDYAGQSLSVAGDINGDGYDDLIIGAYSAAPNGAYSGEAYLVFGRDYRQESPVPGTTGADALLGTAGEDVLIGGDDNDILAGRGGNDVLIGGNGDDILYFDPQDVRRVDGGGGTDTLDFIDRSGVLLDLTAVSNNVYRDIEVIDLTGAGNNTLRLSTQDLLALSGSSNILTVNGNAGDAVELTDFGSWTFQGSSGGYNEYTNGEATLRVLNGVLVSAMLTDDIELPVSQDEMMVAGGDPLPGSVAANELSDSVHGDGILPFTRQLDAARGSFDEQVSRLLEALGRV